MVLRGPNAGSRFLLDSDFTSAGRHPDSDIFLDDVTVSRRHAEFYRHGDRFTVRDVGSLNGTYVNRERIEEAELFGGDEVQIGKFRLLFMSRSPEVGRRARTRSTGLRMTRAGVSIGQVLDELRPEFPDISPSKIRFLEAEGLIQPLRSSSGYRRFAVADIERLRFILTAQRDEYLPLRVIKDRLDEVDGTAGHAGEAAAASR